MTAGILAMLAGLFVVPVALLWTGHRLRRLPPRTRRAFWGGIIGHCVAGTLALVAGMIRPEEWTAQDTARGFLGMWSLVFLPLLGALAGALSTPSRD